MILTDLSPSDIVAGQPLPYSVFDRDRNLLLSQGKIVSAALYEKLTRLGAYKLTLGTAQGPDIRHTVAVPLNEGTASSCVAVLHPARRSSVKPAELFSKWLDFMHITDSINGDAISCRLSLLGVIDDESLMVTSTTLEHNWAAMQIGRRFHATVFDGRKIYTFETSILQRCHDPFRYLHLSFPSELAERPARRTLRASVTVEAVLMHSSEHARESTSATIVDLSATSAGVRTPNTRLSVGAPVTLLFSLGTQQSDQAPIQVSAVVRRQSVDARSAVATYGLEFIDVPATTQALLRDYVTAAVDADNGDAIHSSAPGSSRQD